MYIRLIKSGNIIEIYKYEKPPYRTGGNKRPDGSGEDASETQEENYKQRNVVRRNTVRRLVLANFTNKSKFVTLTYAENMTDVSVAYKDYDIFLKRLKRKHEIGCYLLVVEFQARGAVHLHVIFESDYISNAELSELWGHGFVKITKIDKVDNIGAYVIKYMTKDLSDKRLMGLKAFSHSKHMIQSEIYNSKDPKTIERMLELQQLKKGKNPVYSATYQTEFFGEVQYIEYNLTRE
jgi:hypothetical protein